MPVIVGERMKFLLPSEHLLRVLLLTWMPLYGLKTSPVLLRQARQMLGDKCHDHCLLHPSQFVIDNRAFIQCCLTRAVGKNVSIIHSIPSVSRVFIGLEVVELEPINCTWCSLFPCLIISFFLTACTWCVQVLRSPKEAFAAAMQSWRERCEKSVCLQGDYVEK